MSDYFLDPTYESMDFISKVVAPWKFDLADACCSLPEEITLTLSDIIVMLNGYNNSTFSTLELFNKSIQDNQIIVSYLQSEKWYRTAKCNILDNILTMESFPYDKKIFSMSKCDMQQEAIKVIRLEITDKIIVNAAASYVMRNCLRNDNAYLNKSNLIDVLKLLDIKTNYNKSSKTDNICTQIRNSLETIILEDKWLIRNMTLIEKIVDWINEYSSNNDAASYVNLTKLKVMTHAGNHIYAVKEDL